MSVECYVLRWLGWCIHVASLGFAHVYQAAQELCCNAMVMFDTVDFIICTLQVAKLSEQLRGTVAEENERIKAESQANV